MFNWLGTLWGGKIQFTTPMLFALSFVSMFIIGGLSGIFMAATPVDIFIHDTYFIVAHFHYVLFAGTAMGVFGAIYFWFPKMFGRMMNEFWGKVHFFLTFIFLNGTFFPMHILGVVGFPRRLCRPVPLRDVRSFAAAQRLHDLLRDRHGGAANHLRRQLHLQHVLRPARRAAIRGTPTALEWIAPSPPGHGNFDFQPIVYRGRTNTARRKSTTITIRKSSRRRTAPDEQPHGH